MEERNFLPVGTQIETEQGNIYRIIDKPVGLGGGSILYPVQKLFWQYGVLQASEIPYVLKECYPISLNHVFIRSSSGNVVPKNDNLEDIRYLLRSQQLLLEEGKISQRVYQTASRMLPIQETSQSITLTLPEQETVVVSNTVTIMDSLSEKGQSLSLWMTEQGRFAPLAAFRITQQLLFSLKEVHQAGYLHLDIQDGNVFLRGTLKDRSELVTLIDFGSARPIKDGKTDPIIDKVIFTTQGFSAPEILTKNDGTLQLGVEADIYSVGCLLLYLLTGQKPNSAELLRNHTGIHLQPNQIRRIKCPKHLVARLQKILGSALAKEPENRYHSVDAMLEDVTAFIDELMPARSSLANVDYDAFICYKHGEVDSEAAKLLQNKLEDFRAPRGISSQKNPFKRVFLDDGELSSCADFGEQIRSALKNSSWLIVICSPDTPLSPWVKSEIDTFLEYHDRSRILAVLTGGEPEESFPKQLLGTSCNGEVLAADARGITFREVRKKLSGDSLLRIAAPMLGTTFDGLKQRRKNQLMQRIAAVSATGLVATLAFSAYAVRQNRRIQEEYRGNLLNESKYLAALAVDSFDSGNPLKALEIALRALPSDVQERPVIPQAQYVAEQALGLYTVYDGRLIQNAKVEGTFQHINEVNSGYYFDETHNILLTSDSSYLYIWNAETFQEQGRIAYPYSRSDAFQGQLVNEDKGHLFYSRNDGIGCYDYLNQTELWQYGTGEHFEVEGVLYLPNCEKLAVLEYKSETLQVTMVDAGNGMSLKVYPIILPSHLDFTYISEPSMTASNQEDILVFRLRFEDQKNPEKNQNNYLTKFDHESLAIVNLKTGDVQYIHPGVGWIDSIAFTPQGNLVFSAADSGMFGMYGINIYGDAYTSVVCVDMSNGKTLWKYQDRSCAFYYDRQIQFDSELENIAVVSYGNQCAVLDSITGQCLQQFSMTDAVVSLTVPSNRQFKAYTADGYLCLCNSDSDEWTGIPLWTDGVVEILGENNVFFVKYSEDPSLIRKCNRNPQDKNWKQLIENAKSSQCSLANHYMYSPYTAIYGQYGKPATIYNTETGTLQEVLLNGGDGDCNISIQTVLGIYQLNDVPNLIFDCRDSCGNPSHSTNCLLCVNLDTLQQEMLYMPPPGEDISPEYWQSCLEGTFRVHHMEDTVYFACTESYYDESNILMDGLFVFSWKIGDPRSHIVAEYSRKSLDGADYATSFNIEAVIPSPDGCNLLILDSHYGGQQIYDIYHVDIQERAVKKIISDLELKDSLQGLYEYLVFWNNGGTSFAIPRNEDIVIYDLAGMELCSIPCPEAAQNVRSISFVPETNYVLVLSSDSWLSMYDINSGQLIDSCCLYNRSLGKTRWQYLEDNTLIVDFYWGIATINMSPETWGLSSIVNSAVGYDVQHDRFYTLSEGANGKWPLGYFQRYSIDDIVAMGNTALGNGE